MAAINSLLNEIRFEMLKVIILNAFLDATVVFLVLLLLLSIFGIGVMLPLLVAVLFLAGDVWWRARQLSLKYIEDRNPEIREMLRTAADNKSEENLMAHALFADLIEKMREVSSGTFLDFKQIGFKVAAMFVLSLTLVSLAFFNVNIQKFENPLPGMKEKFDGYFGGLVGDEGVEGIDLEGADDDIYGDPSIARLGDEDLDIKLEQSLNRIDFTTVDEADPSSDVPDSYPVDVSAQASEAYTGGLTNIKDRETAADYSQKIK